MPSPRAAAAMRSKARATFGPHRLALALSSGVGHTSSKGDDIRPFPVPFAALCGNHRSVQFRRGPIHGVTRASQGRATVLMDSVAGNGYTGLVFDRLAKQICQTIGSEGSSIFARDRRSPGTAIAVAACGPHEGIVGTRFSAVAGLPGISPRSGDASIWQSTAEGAYDRPGRGGRVVARAGRDGRIFGALIAKAGKGRRFATRELELLSELADTAAAAFEHAERRDDTLRAVRARVGELVRMVEAHDRYTGGHSESVVEWSCAVGERLELGLPDLLELEVGALLHDLGKVRVPGAVLRKPLPLSQLEGRIVNRHPAWGAELLASMPGLEPVATVVRFHHERWDGRGYPHRLRGERIPLASRIIAVCDAYDAMISDRPYRAALPPALAVSELTAGAGTQFDPAVVRSFLEVLAERARSSGTVAGPELAA